MSAVFAYIPRRIRSAQSPTYGASGSEQAIHLARVLLAVTQDWEEVDITGYRFEKRQQDGTYRLTITSGTGNSAE